jgi:hypothetical protein
MDPGLRLRRPDSPSKEDAVKLSKIPYGRLVGRMGYVALGSRPDIQQTIQELSSFVNNYGYVHWEAAKRCARYLKATRDYELVLGGRNQIVLAGYVDSSYGSCPDTAKSVTGYTFNLGAGAVSWASRKQQTVAQSSCEAEYVAAGEAAKEVAWLRQLLEAIGFPQDGPTVVRADNNGAISLSEDPSFHARVKHIHVRHHYLRQQVAEKELKLKYVPSNDNVADTLTKPLAKQSFIKFRSMLGVERAKLGEEEC